MTITPSLVGSQRQERDTSCVLAGDWHGNLKWARSVIHWAAEAGVQTVYQLGDFGLWPGNSGKAYLQGVLEEVSEQQITLWIVPGNHEDYSQIEDPEDPGGGLERQIIGAGDGWELAVLPRGYSWEFGGRKFLALGGAPSIDFEHRTEGVSWWREEALRESDLKRLTRNADGSVDVMLAHDSPDGGTDEVQAIIDTPPGLSMWSEPSLRYAHEGRAYMTAAVDMIKPKLFAHGHYHVRGERIDEETGQHWVSLNLDGTFGNVAVLDTETMKIGWV